MDLLANVLISELEPNLDGRDRHKLKDHNGVIIHRSDRFRLLCIRDTHDRFSHEFLKETIKTIDN